jgi:hypothetical protein
MARLGVTDLAGLGGVGLGEADFKELGLPMKVPSSPAVLFICAI